MLSCRTHSNQQAAIIHTITATAANPSQPQPSCTHACMHPACLAERVQAMLQEPLGHLRKYDVLLMGTDANRCLGNGPHACDSAVGPCASSQTNALGLAAPNSFSSMNVASASTFSKRTARGWRRNAVGDCVRRATPHDAFTHASQHAPST